MGLDPVRGRFLASDDLVSHRSEPVGQLGSVALGLLYARRPARARSVACVLAALAVAASVGTPTARAAERPDPLFAYYYIWFNGTSWDRAKTDYPVLGRYSSDDRGVTRRAPG